MKIDIPKALHHIFAAVARASAGVKARTHRMIRAAIARVRALIEIERIAVRVRVTA